MTIADDIEDRLFGPGVGSDRRLGAMLQELRTVADPAIFWRVFQETWSSCDDTSKYRDELVAELYSRQPMVQFLRAGNRLFFDALSDEFIAYRGCDRSKQQGVSWTTNSQVAEKFALGHRGISVPDPVVVCVAVRKSDILAVDTARGEDEILVDVVGAKLLPA